MRKLINLLMVVVAISITTGVLAQNIIVKGGLNLSNQLVKDDNVNYSNDSMFNYKLNPGFHAGLAIEFPIGNIFSVEPGLLISTKGYRIKEDVLNMTLKGSANPLYIEMPVNGKVAFDLGGIKVYLAAGPYIGYGLGGKFKSETTDESGNKETDETVITWGSHKEDHFKNLDYGVTATGGFEVSRFMLSFSYGYGLANISNFTDNGFKINNRVMGITAAYKLVRL